MHFQYNTNLITEPIFWPLFFDRQSFRRHNLTFNVHDLCLTPCLSTCMTHAQGRGTWEKEGTRN